MSINQDYNKILTELAYSTSPEITLELFNIDSRSVWGSEEFKKEWWYYIQASLETHHQDWVKSNINDNVCVPFEIVEFTHLENNLQYSLDSLSDGTYIFMFIIKSKDCEDLYKVVVSCNDSWGAL